MKICLYSYQKRKLIKLGHLIASTGRITEAALSGSGMPEFIDPETDFEFKIEKISKGRHAYRDFGLTHKLHCKELNQKGFKELHVRLGFIKSLIIRYYNRAMFWQKPEFTTKLFYTVLVAILGLAMFFAKEQFAIAKKNREREDSISKPMNTRAGNEN